MNETTYQFYFGVATPDTNEDVSNYFQDKNGKHFYYKIVVDEDMFYIYDTCGRMMPVDREFVDNFGTAMYGVSGVYTAANEAEELFNKRIREVEALVEFWSTEGNE
jgi:hypothetical protein